MLLHLRRLLDTLTAPELPGLILAVTGSVATLLVVAGIGAWSIVGAWKIFLYLIGLGPFAKP